MSTIEHLRTRSFSWTDPAAGAAAALRMPGLECMQAIIDGTLSPPPIAELLDLAIVEVEHGRAVFAMEPAEWMYNPIGSVHGGIAATILDSCMGCAPSTAPDHARSHGPGANARQKERHALHHRW
jgi:hypothetical protein